MADIVARRELREAAILRLKAIKCGQPVTNVCAGEKNPRWHAYFLSYVVKSRKTSYGMIQNEHWAKCTDKKGNAWLTSPEVIYPGHLDDAACIALFAPVWQAEYGEPPAAASIGRASPAVGGGG